MASRAGLTRETSRKRAAMRLLLVVAMVLVLHVFVLDWLARLQMQTTALKPMTGPLLTRVLQQQASAPSPALAPPAPAQVPVRPVRRAPVPEPSVALITSSPAPTETQTVTPEPPTETVAAAPSPEPAPVTPPAPAEPTPETSASAPTGTNTAAATATADSWPIDTRLNYTLSGRFRSGDLYGSARVQWQREGERYQVRVNIDIKVFASLTLTSQGTVTPQGLHPTVYEELRRNGVRTAKIGEREITLSGGRSVPRPDGVQDTASQFVELAHRFATGVDTLEVGRTVSLWLARPGGVDLWTYDIRAKETLQSDKLGAIEAYHLKPRPIANPRGNVTAEMWFAPSLQHLPVRIRVSIGEEAVVDLMVESIEQR